MNTQKINSASISRIQEIKRRLKTINPDDTVSHIMGKFNQPPLNNITANTLMSKQEQTLINTSATNTNSTLFCPPEKEQSHTATIPAEFSPRQLEEKPVDHKLTTIPQEVSSLNLAVSGTLQSQNKVEPSSQNKIKHYRKYPDGNKYFGELLNGYHHGTGTFIFSDKRIYSGEFNHGNFHGNGKLFIPNSGTYEGLFINNVLEGEVKYTSARGPVMTLTYKNGKSIPVTETVLHIEM